jgi:hypothetical protein
MSLLNPLEACATSSQRAGGRIAGLFSGLNVKSTRMTQGSDRLASAFGRIRGPKHDLPFAKACEAHVPTEQCEEQRAVQAAARRDSHKANQQQCIGRFATDSLILD